MGKDSDWPRHTVAMLLRLWDEPDADGKPRSASAIGELMGLTKNAVVGKAHRLNKQNPDWCKPRPSPIKRDGVVRSARPAGAVQWRAKETLPSLAPAAPPLPAPVPPLAPVLSPQPRLSDVVVQPVPDIQFVRSRRPCCWIVSGVRRAAVYCDAPTVPGRSYCAEHLAIAYVRRAPAPVEQQTAAGD